MKTAPSNSDEIIDSRDIIERIEELQDDIEAEQDAADEAKAEGVLRAPRDLDDERAELAALRALEKEAEGCCPDWSHGAALIREDCFEDYARELSSDLHGSRSIDMEWPFNCIDWPQAAEQLAEDYTSVDFDGVSYYVR